jgi:hypothetical protein
MTSQRPGVVVATTKRRLLSAGNPAYLLAAIDGAAGGRRRSGAWPSGSTAVARPAGHGQSNATGGSFSPWKESRCSQTTNSGPVRGVALDQQRARPAQHVDAGYALHLAELVGQKMDAAPMVIGDQKGLMLRPVVSCGAHPPARPQSKRPLSDAHFAASLSTPQVANPLSLVRDTVNVIPTQKLLPPVTMA